ncbi:MAG: ExbD/TolR family protein [Gammaproteobacteria bacterium]|nr:ExbD/TolR family protein [Gammaproteobacteria bacterium]
MKRRRRRHIAEMNVVPYIDVMLVLLIIFMVTSPMLKLTEGVEVDLPKAASKAVPPSGVRGPIIVTVDAEGNFSLAYSEQEGSAGAAISARVLLTRVTALLRVQPDRQVLVRGDAAVSHGRVVQLMVLLRNAGVSKAGLLTESPKPAEGKENQDSG